MAARDGVEGEELVAVVRLQGTASPDVDERSFGAPGHLLSDGTRTV